MTTTQDTTESATAVVLVVSLAAFLASLDLFIVNIAFPEIRVAFGAAGLSATSWVLSGYTMVFAAFLNPAGRLGDRYGHRQIFLWGVAVFTIASSACGAALSLPMLIASRVVQAVGAAMLMPSSLALLMAAVPESRRSAAVSTWSAVGAMAAALGPPVGGALVATNWRWIFLVNVPVGLIAVAAGCRALPKTQRAAGAPLPDILGALSLIVGVAALIWILVDLPAGIGAAELMAAATIAAVSIALTVWRSWHHHTPAMDLQAIRVPAMWSSSIALLLFAAAFAAMLLSSVMLLTTVWHETPARAGLHLSPGPLVVVVVSLTLAGRTIERFGIGATAAAGAVLYAFGVLVWIGRVGLPPDYLTDFLPGQLLTGAGVGLVIPALSAVTGKALPGPQWGSGSALTNTARQLGTVLGTAVLTMICEPTINLSTIRYGWTFVAIGADGSAVIAAAIALWWRPKTAGAQ